MSSWYSCFFLIIRIAGAEGKTRVIPEVFSFFTNVCVLTHNSHISHHRCNYSDGSTAMRHQPWYVWSVIFSQGRNLLPCATIPKTKFKHPHPLDLFPFPVMYYSTEIMSTVFPTNANLVALAITASKIPLTFMPMLLIQVDKLGPFVLPDDEYIEAN